VVNGQLAGLMAVLAVALRPDDQLSIFLVDGTPGSSIEVGANKAKFGLRSAATCDITFKECKASWRE
jgi:alkylation response protein AidB-like acyl-CoA dehydrogenase